MPFKDPIFAFVPTYPIVERVIVSPVPEARVVPSRRKRHRIDLRHMREGSEICSRRYVPQLNCSIYDPEARVFPSRENATELTSDICERVAKFAPVVTSHSLTVASTDPEARVFPSRENATELTQTYALQG